MRDSRIAAVRISWVFPLDRALQQVAPMPLRRVRAAMLFEYLLVIGAVALVAIAASVKLNGSLKDLFQREVKAAAKSRG